jgi:hypothetical protein
VRGRRRRCGPEPYIICAMSSELCNAHAARMRCVWRLLRTHARVGNNGSERLSGSKAGKRPRRALISAGAAIFTAPESLPTPKPHFKTVQCVNCSEQT